MSKPTHPHTAQTTTPAKTRHYVAVLSAALLRGSWADSVVGKDYKGRDMDWAELLRKWEKHGGNNPDLIHHLREISLLYLSHASPSASGYITVPQPYSSSTASNETDHSAISGVTGGTHTTTASGSGTATSDGSFVHVHHPAASVPASPTRPTTSSSRPQGTTAGGPSTSTPTRSGVVASTSTSASTPSRAHAHGATSSAAERAAYLQPTSLEVSPDSSSLSDSDEDDPWRLSNAWWKGVPADRREEVEDGIKGLEALVLKGKLNPAEREAAKLCWAYHLHAVGRHEAAGKMYDEVQWEEVSGGRVEGGAVISTEAGAVAVVRGRCLQAMSLELLDPSDPLALSYYLSSIQTALPLLSLPTPSYLLPTSSTSSPPTQPASRRGTVSSTSTSTPAHSRLPTTSSTGTSTSASSPLAGSSTPFEPLRELHRWLNTALVRATVLSARQTGPDALQQLMRVLRTYHQVAAYGAWPPGWRPRERGRMLGVYMEVLRRGVPVDWEKIGVPGTLYDHLSSTSAQVQGQGHGEQMTAKTVWKAEVITTLRQGRDLLSSTTTFPRSGTRNVAVQDFVESAVALALLADDADSSSSSIPSASSSSSTQVGQRSGVLQEVIITLYWAQTITFNSQAILRHLSTLLAKQGEWVEARRTFEAYVRSVRKDREANGSEDTEGGAEGSGTGAVERAGGAGMAGGGGRIMGDVDMAKMEANAEGRDTSVVRRDTHLDGSASGVDETTHAQTDESAGTEGSGKVDKHGLAVEADETFARTLLLGARIIGREMGDMEVAMEYVKEAAGLYGDDKGKEHLGQDRDKVDARGAGKEADSRVRAEVHALWGVLEGKVAVGGTMSPTARQSLLDSAISHLSTSSSLYPSPQTSYYLARLYAFSGRLEEATKAIRTCLESEDTSNSANANPDAQSTDASADQQQTPAPESIAAWHLLALLRTADRDWDGALRACEAGIGAWEEGEDIREAREPVEMPLQAQSQGQVQSRKGSVAPSVANTTRTGQGRVASKDYGVTESFSTLALDESGHSGKQQGQDQQQQHQQSRRTSLSSMRPRDWPALITDNGHLSPLPSSTTGLALSQTYALCPGQHRQQRLADVIALRQTGIVITEKGDGAELALEQQRELFGFFKAHSRPSVAQGLGLGMGQGQRRQRSGTAGTANTVDTVMGEWESVGRNEGGGLASIAASPQAPQAGSQSQGAGSGSGSASGQGGLGLVGAGTGSAGPGGPGGPGGDRLRGMTPVHGDREGEMEVLRGSGEGVSESNSIPSLNLPDSPTEHRSSGSHSDPVTPIAHPHQLTASPVSTLRAAHEYIGTPPSASDASSHSAADEATAALDKKPLAPILLGPPIGTSASGSGSGTASPAQAGSGDGSGSGSGTGGNSNTIDLSDEPHVSLSPRTKVSGLPNSVSTTEALSASAHPQTQGDTQGAAQALQVPAIPLITESGASTPLSSARESDSGSGPGTGTRTTNSPPGSVRFQGHAGEGSEVSPSKGKGKSHTLGFGKLHVPLLKGNGGHTIGGKQRAGTTQSLGVAGRGLESPSAPDLAATRNQRITSQSSIALSTTSNAPSIFKRIRHPYATSTYAQSTTSKRRSGRNRRQTSGAASIASNMNGNTLNSAVSAPGSARRQSSPLSSPPAPPSGLGESKYHGRTPTELRILSDLWLASAATYRRLGELDQARGAIQEAESYDSENPAVWVQLALCELAEAEETIEMQLSSGVSGQQDKDAQRAAGRFDRAIATLNKALAVQGDYLPAIIHLAKLYLVRAVSIAQSQALKSATSQTPQQKTAAEGDVALCEALLNGAIEGVAWGCTEAYALRAECRRLRGDEVGEREDLIRALEGEVGRGIRGWEVVSGWI